MDRGTRKIILDVEGKFRLNYWREDICLWVSEWNVEKLIHSVTLILAIDSYINRNTRNFMHVCNTGKKCLTRFVFLINSFKFINYHSLNRISYRMLSIHIFSDNSEIFFVYVYELFMQKFTYMLKFYYYYYYYYYVTR